MRTKLARKTTHSRVQSPAVFTKTISPQFLKIALLGAPLLLLTPVIYYSLTTPFSLIDDYVHSDEFRDLMVFNDIGSFLDWWYRNFVSSEIERFRPLWELANGFVMVAYGPTPMLHHLSRWPLHFASVAMFVSAVAVILKTKHQSTTTTVSGLAHSPRVLIPIALMIYIWIFFPNSPVSRLQPQELQTVFFLGLCNWMAALMLAESPACSPRRAYLTRALLCFGCLGLSWSKEVNVSLAACIFLFQFALLRWRRQHVRSEVTWGILLFSITAFATLRVYATSRNVGIGYGHDLTEVDLVYNIETILKGLFQIETSMVILVVFLGLGIAPLASFIKRFRQRGLDPIIFFMMFLFAQSISLFLTLSLSWGVVHRYWYPMIPLLSIAMAFSAYYVIGAASRRSSRTGRFAKASLLIFMAFYIACNYSNFLFQTIVQHSAGSLAQKVVREVTRLLKDGEPVWIEDTGREYEEKLIGHFNYNGFLAPDTWHEPVHTGRPHTLPYYYHVNRSAPTMPGALVWSAGMRRSYTVFSIASAVAEFLQGGERHLSVDAGVPPSFDSYRWNIYLVEENRSRLVHAEFDVYLDHRARSLSFVKKPCGPEDLHAHISLHIVAQDKRVHPPPGFDNMDFIFRERGGRQDDDCIARVELPNYAIDYFTVARVDADGERIWGTYFVLNESALTKSEAGTIEVE